MSQRKRPITLADIERFERAIAIAKEALDVLGGPNGIGYYIPVKWVDALIRAERTLDLIEFELSDVAARQRR